MVQLPFSVWWLRNHRYGPLEWLWRRLTYGEVPASDAGEPLEPAGTRVTN